MGIFAPSFAFCANYCILFSHFLFLVFLAGGRAFPEGSSPFLIEHIPSTLFLFCWLSHRTSRFFPVSDFSKHSLLRKCFFHLYIHGFSLAKIPPSKEPTFRPFFDPKDIIGPLLPRWTRYPVPPLEEQRPSSDFSPPSYRRSIWAFCRMILGSSK